ncbi:MAG: efflux RND transporter periplasmic adaptor subunit [Candidatus Acidiferrales bacterium]
MHRKTHLINVAMAAVCLMLAGGCEKKQVAAGPPPAIPVRVAKAETRTVPIQVTAIGNVEAFATVSVKPLVAGELQSIHFAEGQDVKKGDLLFVIDRKPFEAALEQTQANMAKDKATAINARAEAGRYSNLFSQGVISREQAEQATSTADAAEATVKADQAAVDYAKLNLEYCTISSPIDGRTGSYQVKPGNLVKANDVPVLIVINQISPIYLDFSVPETYLANIKKYMLESTLHVQATIPSDPGAPEMGTVTFVDNTVDITTGTIRLKATFANEKRRLWPGQYVNTVLTLSAITNATVVPSQALQTGQNGQFIFVIGDDGTAESRNVTTSRTTEGFTVIEKGVKPGETVVTDGQLRLIPGSKVSILADATQGGAKQNSPGASTTAH